MSGPKPAGTARMRRLAIVLVTALVGVGTAALVASAVAKTFTLTIAHNASVTNANTKVTTQANIVTAARGRAVYTLSGDTKSHPKCTKANGCFSFWPPVRVSSARKLSKAPGIKGRLGTWRRDGFIQVTLAGHPLYTFAPDSRDHATGDGFVGFKGTWHVIKTSADTAGGSMTTTTGTTTTSPSPPGY